MQIVERGAVRFAVLPEDGPMLTGETTALDVIADAFGQDVDLIAIPKTRLPAEFLQLETRILGEVAQKFVNYNIKVGFIGDFSTELAASSALSDYFYETNKGKSLLFAGDLDELAQLLSA